MVALTVKIISQKLDVASVRIDSQKNYSKTVVVASNKNLLEISFTIAAFSKTFPAPPLFT
jgi:hypothetical protein